MADSFRAVCADAADYLKRLSEKLTTPDDLNEADELEYRLRAALSQPAPEPPTGKELTALVRVFQSAYNAKRSELRALPNQYREDTAGDMADHAGISAVLGSKAMPNHTPNRPLWQVMRDAYDDASLSMTKITDGYAAEIRAIADWLVPEMPEPYLPDYPDLLTAAAWDTWRAKRDLRFKLLAEADRAEVGDD